MDRMSSRSERRNRASLETATPVAVTGGLDETANDVDGRIVRGAGTGTGPEPPGPGGGRSAMNELRALPLQLASDSLDPAVSPSTAAATPRSASPPTPLSGRLSRRHRSTSDRPGPAADRRRSTTTADEDAAVVAAAASQPEVASPAADAATTPPDSDPGIGGKRRRTTFDAWSDC